MGRSRSAFSESKHPRGRPGNAGQFRNKPRPAQPAPPPSARRRDTTAPDSDSDGVPLYPTIKPRDVCKKLGMGRTSPYYIWESAARRSERKSDLLEETLLELQNSVIMSRGRDLTRSQVEKTSKSLHRRAKALFVAERAEGYADGIRKCLGLINEKLGAVEPRSGYGRAPSPDENVPEDPYHYFRLSEPDEAERALSDWLTEHDELVRPIEGLCDSADARAELRDMTKAHSSFRYGCPGRWVGYREGFIATKAAVEDLYGPLPDGWQQAEIATAPPAPAA